MNLLRGKNTKTQNESAPWHFSQLTPAQKEALLKRGAENFSKYYLKAFEKLAQE